MWQKLGEYMMVYSDKDVGQRRSFYGKVSRQESRGNVGGKKYLILNQK